MTIIHFEQYTPNLAPEVYLAPGARIIGQVSIGKKSSIWFNAVVRGDMDRVDIGMETNIQDNTTIHADRGIPVYVGNRVTVGHNAVLHSCSVEDDVLVGMNAVLLDGAAIGVCSIVAAGAVVTPGIVIPPRSLVAGVPGRVIRELSTDELLRVQSMYQDYLELSRIYRKQTEGKKKRKP